MKIASPPRIPTLVTSNPLILVATNVLFPRMATLQELSEEERADVDTACGYFTVHEDRMKYDEYLAAGLPIATGVIEGACRHLVKDRLERTGMRWSTSGAQAMLSLWCQRASDGWDDFQKQFLNPTRIRG